jgi:hypothetical protein
MVLVPGATPVIIPELEPMVTAVKLLLVHMPPGVPALNVNVAVEVPHSVEVPEIAGVGAIVTM